jgi:hypothetical protein
MQCAYGLLKLEPVFPEVTCTPRVARLVDLCVNNGTDMQLFTASKQPA